MDWTEWWGEPKGLTDTYVQRPQLYSSKLFMHYKNQESTQKLQTERQGDKFIINYPSIMVLRADHFNVGGVLYYKLSLRLNHTAHSFNKMQHQASQKQNTVW